MDVIFNRDSLTVAGLNRLPASNEVAIYDVDTSELKKAVIYTEVTETGKYYLPQDPLEVPISYPVQTETTEQTDAPVIITENKRVPMLDAAGNQKSYYPITIETDENGNEIPVESSVPLLLWTTEPEEKQKVDAAGNPLYIKTETINEVQLQEQPPLLIDKEDPRWTEELEQEILTEEKTKVLTFAEDPNAFNYAEVLQLKRLQTEQNKSTNQVNFDQLGETLVMALMNDDALGETVVDILNRLEALENAKSV